MARSKSLNDKNDIIDVAFGIMDSEGAEALSVRRVAKEMGISFSTLYNYVLNVNEIKKEIIVHSFNLLYQEIFSLLAEMSKGGQADLADFCRAYARAYYNFAATHKHICAYIIGAGYENFHEDAELRPLYDGFGSFFLRGGNSEENKRLKYACYTFEALVRSALRDSIAGIIPLTKTQMEYVTELFIERMILC